MGVLRKHEVTPQFSTTEIEPGQKEPATSVRPSVADFPKTPISIPNDQLRREPIPLEWLDLKALTQYVAVSRRTLTEWLYRPENPLPACRIDGKVYVRRGDFDRWMELHPVEGPVNLGKLVDDIMADLLERE